MNNLQTSIPCFDASASEAKAIGHLLRRPDRVVSLNATAGLASEHFGSDIHKQAWQFLFGRAEAGESIDPKVLVAECSAHLKELGGAVAGEALIVQWFSEPWELNFESYAKIILDMSARRETFAKVAEVQEDICSGNDLDEVAESLRLSATVADSFLVGCRWEIAEAADYWTADPSEIATLSDSPIIEGLIREREIIQLVGPAKSQKTWFAMHAARAVASGADFIGRKTAKKRVLYIDYELKQSTLRKRISMVCETKPEGLDILSLRGEEKLPEIKKLKSIIKKGGYGLVVIDSLYCTGWLSEENNNDSVSRELRRLQTVTSAVGVSLLIVDHTAKGGGKERSAVDSSRGASAKGGFFDGVLTLRPQEKCPEGENRVILDMALRDFPAPSALPVLGYSFTATSCDMDVAGEADKSDLNGTRQRVFEELNRSEDGLTTADIVKVTPISESTVRRTLRELVREGKVVEFPDPSHQQRKKFRVLDMADNHAKNSKTKPKR